MDHREYQESPPSLLGPDDSIVDNQNGNNGVVEDNLDSMDISTIQSSMDAAIRESKAAGDSQEKQDQLRAMYLAGFRAAQARNAESSLRKNFENAKEENEKAPARDESLVVPLNSSVGAAGIVQLSQPLGMSPTGIPSRTVSETGNASTRRLTRTSSLSSNNTQSSPALSATSSPSGGSSGGSNPFPKKLMDMLFKEDSSVVAWLPQGDAFMVRDVDRFVADILPRYFRHTKLTSFQRQLNLYGFRRTTKGPEAGAYRHEMFHRDLPDRCLQMKRSKQKGSASPQMRGRARSNSATSSPLLTPEHSPSSYALGPGALSQSAPSVLTDVMGRPRVSSSSEQRQTNFRLSDRSNASGSTVAKAPTGLSLLLGGGVGGSAGPSSGAATTPSSQPDMTHLTKEQQAKIMQDRAEQDRQASALAAAGMAVDTVGLCDPSDIDQLDAMNFNLEFANMHVDDLDLDFATLFDTANEELHLQNHTQGKAPPHSNGKPAPS